MDARGDRIYDTSLYELKIYPDVGPGFMRTGEAANTDALNESAHDEPGGTWLWSSRK
jgi:hypothetical protein